MRASLELKEKEDRKFKFAQEYLSKGDVPDPQEESTQRQISNVIASQVGQDVPNDLFIRPQGEYSTEELQMLNIVRIILMQCLRSGKITFLKFDRNSIVC